MRNTTNNDCFRQWIINKISSCSLKVILSKTDSEIGKINKRNTYNEINSTEINPIIVDSGDIFKLIKKETNMEKEPEGLELITIQSQQYYKAVESGLVISGDVNYLYNAIYLEVPLPEKASEDSEIYNVVSVVLEEVIEENTSNYLITQFSLHDTVLPEESGESLKILIQL